MGYARGPVLADPDLEMAKTLFGRKLVRERLERAGSDGIFDLTGLPRAWPLKPDDLPKLTSQLTYFAHFEGQAEPLALAYVGADPRAHGALVCNRVSAATFAVMLTFVKRGDTVISIAPEVGTRSQPSVQRAVDAVGGIFLEAIGFDAFRDLAEHQPDAKLFVVTPTTADKRKLPVQDYLRMIEYARERGVLLYSDDAHMASRCFFYEEPVGFELGGGPDLLVFSADKLMVGPRSGVLVGRQELITRIRRVAVEFGLDAQFGQYVGVLRALEGHDPEAIRACGRLAHDLLRRIRAAYGEHVAYLAGPGIAMQGDTAIDIAMRIAGTDRAALTALEATTVVSNRMLTHHGLATIGAFSVPGAAPVIRVLLFPDGARAGIDHIVTGLEDGLQTLATVLNEVDAAREIILGADRVLLPSAR